MVDNLKTHGLRNHYSYFDYTKTAVQIIDNTFDPNLNQSCLIFQEIVISFNLQQTK